ncbi:MAG: hypothetical protein Q9191_002613 [Dirinaria sp. TL-2023a]
MRYLYGCSYVAWNVQKYLPQCKLTSHTTILGTTSRTILEQDFFNDSGSTIKECRYEFPLYDGVSVVGFNCRIASRLIRGIVREKTEAQNLYKDAQVKGETAGLLEQGPTSDVFSTTLGNIPHDTCIRVEITYIGELKHDVAAESIRFMIPTHIAPRYGILEPVQEYRTSLQAVQHPVKAEGDGVSITVDVDMVEGSFVQEIRSPSHPISVTLGKTSKPIPGSELKNWQASVSLSQGSAELDRDFVLEIVNRAASTPKAVLESHPKNPQCRALMATLVPSFDLPPAKPEIIIVADRSGSMISNIPTLITALKIFLRSLPVGTQFNIYSFGSGHTLLWKGSRAYDEKSLDEATKHVETFEANYGGTETLAAIKASIEARDVQKDLALILCTDGDIWPQQELFSYLSTQIHHSQKAIRVFPLGIGNAVSSGLIEGVAKAGKGFASFVGEHEKIDAKVVRMLKAALMENLIDCSLEVRYEREAEDDDDFVVVERVSDSLRAIALDDFELEDATTEMDIENSSERTTKESKAWEKETLISKDGDQASMALPALQVPKLHQTPQDVPPLYPSNGTTIYLLMSPSAPQRKPTSVIFKATSSQGRLEVSIPVEILAEPGETIHQLAARKAVQELEDGRGWLFQARDKNGILLREKYKIDPEKQSLSEQPDFISRVKGLKQSVYDSMVKREAVRLGIKYQVGGRWCSFVAIEGNEASVQPGNSYAPAVESSFPHPGGLPYTGGLPYAGGFPYAGGLPYPGGLPHPRLSQRMRSPAMVSAPARSNRGPQKETRGGQAPLAISEATFQPRSKRSRSASFDDEITDKLPAVPGATQRCTQFFCFEPHKLESASGDAMGFASMSEESPTPQKTPANNVLDRIISLQRYQGSWELDHALLDVCGVAKSTAAGAMQADESSAEPLRKTTVWATILALVYLERVLAKDKGAWELLVDKAKSLLQNSGVQMQAEMEESPLKELLDEIPKQEALA